MKLEGKSGKIISVGCCFPPKFANSGTVVWVAGLWGVVCTNTALGSGCFDAIRRRNVVFMLASGIITSLFVVM